MSSDSTLILNLIAHSRPKHVRAEASRRPETHAKPAGMPLLGLVHGAQREAGDGTRGVLHETHQTYASLDALETRLHGLAPAPAPQSTLDRLEAALRAASATETYEEPKCLDCLGTGRVLNPQILLTHPCPSCLP